jgi:outer membrane immunogenic protein
MAFKLMIFHFPRFCLSCRGRCRGGVFLQNARSAECGWVLARSGVWSIELEGSVKKFLLVSVSLAALTGNAVAADLAPRPYKAMPMAVYNWTGLYVGGHVGGSWVDENATLLSTTGPLLNPLGTVIGGNRSGFLGGVQAGYNYQVSNWVLGVGADASWTDVSVATATAATLIPGGVTNTQGRTNWYVTATGRIGYAWNNVLVYGKGGAAWINENYSGSASALGNTVTTNPITDTRSGWTAGAGVEYGFAPNWSVFAEYDYLAFGSKNYTVTANVPVTSVTSIKTNIDVFKLGANLRF